MGQRKAAAAQKAAKDLQRQLAAVEEALDEERQKVAAAEQALAEQRQTAVTPPKVSEPAAGTGAGFGSCLRSHAISWLSWHGSFQCESAARRAGDKATATSFEALHGFLTGDGQGDFGYLPLSRMRRTNASPTRCGKHPFYHALLQTYLTWQQSLSAFIDDADMDKKDADRARFVLSLFADSVAPTNTLLGNPAAMKQMYQTGGASLVKGLTHMIEDLANNGGLPSQVDMKAFQVGKDLGISPDPSCSRTRCLK